MKQRRFLPFTSVAGVVTAVLVSSVVACGNNEQSPSAGARSKLSGEDVFRGLAFHEGAVVAVLPELGGGKPAHELTPEVRASRESVKARMLADMRELDPTFFERFGADIQSGDHLRIEQAMKESAQLVKKAVAKRAQPMPVPGAVQGTCTTNTVTSNVTMDNTSDGNVSYNNSVSENSVYANSVSGNIAYNNSVYGNLDDGNTVQENTSYANEVYANDNNDPENAWGGTPLERDQLVDLIATRLAAE